jgi:GAF domain-containing protein
MEDCCISDTVCSVENPAETIEKLKAELKCALRDRDNAIRAAQLAVYDTTRITRLLAILSEPAPIKTILDRLMVLISELFSADIVVILDPVGTGSFVPLASLGIPERYENRSFSNEKDNYLATVLRINDVISSDHADDDTRVDQILRDLGAETVVAIPLTTAYGLSRGVMMLARCNPAIFSQKDIDLLKTMGHRIGLTIEQAQQNVQLQKIIETGYEITRLFDISDIGNEAVRVFSSIFCADAATIVLKNHKNTPECIAWIGLDSDQVDVCATVTDSLLNDYLFGATRLFSTPDLHDTVRRLSLNLPENFPVRALMAVPLFRNRHVYGLLYGLRFSAVPFSQETLQLATLFAAQISVTIENARLYNAK